MLNNCAKNTAAALLRFKMEDLDQKEGWTTMWVGRNKIPLGAKIKPNQDMQKSECCISLCTLNNDTVTVFLLNSGT